MTSDAKIGLLLGLVFIFVIAFIINGLPAFSTADSNNSNELTTNMVSYRSSELAIGERERKMEAAVIDPVQVESPVVEAVVETVAAAEPAVIGEDVRFVAELPKSTAVETAAVQAAEVETVLQVTAEKDSAVSKAVERGEVYVVTKGDTLASIAKKVYGPEEGNRIVNIDKIYQANKGQMKSRDSVVLGQELLIPVISVEKEKESIFKSDLFDKVKSIGFNSRKDGEKFKTVVVEEGDSLWKIAVKNLGDGNRYKDLLDLNSDILKSKDSIRVGMNLKIPVE